MASDLLMLLTLANFFCLNAIYMPATSHRRIINNVSNLATNAVTNM